MSTWAPKEANVRFSRVLALIQARMRGTLQRFESRTNRGVNGSGPGLIAALCATAAISATLLPATAALAQSTFGTILGTVQDISGAVIPGAVITVHSLDENEERTTTSGTDGEFVFENLKAGHYKVTVHKAGFTDSVVSSATLEARQQLRLPVTLSITAGTTTVEVSADGALINTENATLSDTIPSLDITQLP